MLSIVGAWITKRAFIYIYIYVCVYVYVHIFLCELFSCDDYFSVSLLSSPLSNIIEQF